MFSTQPFSQQAYQNTKNFYSPSTLSEQEVPMPVSPLSEAILCLLMWLLRWLDGTAVACHNDSLPGNHADEE